MYRISLKDLEGDTSCHLGHTRGAEPYLSHRVWLSLHIRKADREALLMSCIFLP